MSRRRLQLLMLMLAIGAPLRAVAMPHPDEEASDEAPVTPEPAELLPPIGPLIDALRNPDWRIRQDAASKLGSRKDEENLAVLSLLDAARDENAEVRTQAIYALDQLQPDPGRVQDTYLAAVKDSDDDVRGAAARALGHLHSPPPGVVQVLVGLVNQAATRTPQDYTTLHYVGSSYNLARGALEALKVSENGNPVGQEAEEALKHLPDLNQMESNANAQKALDQYQKSKQDQAEAARDETARRWISEQPLGIAAAIVGAGLVLGFLILLIGKPLFRWLFKRHP